MLQELRNILTQYVNREVSRNALEDWLVSHLQAILDSHDQAAIEIANTLDPLLVELREGLITEEEFFRAAEGMSRKAATAVIVISGVAATTSTAAATVCAVNLTQAPRLLWAPA